MRPGYKQTEVGVIPEDWAQTTIRGIATKVGSGVTPTGGSRRYKEYGRPFVRSQNVGWGRLILDDLVFIDEETHNGFPATELRKYDVLLNITGASIGRTALADDSLVGGNVNQHVCIIRVDTSLALPSFVNLLLLSPLGQRQIDSFQTGGNRQGLNFAQASSIKLALPRTKAEQEAIAEALSDADGLIESLEQLIAKKRAIKQGAMHELLTGENRLPGFDGEWESRTIEQLENAKLVKLSRGKVISRKTIDQVPGDCPIYSSSVNNDGLFGHYGHFMFYEELITWSVDGGGDFFYRPKHKFSVTNVCGFMHVDTSRISYRFLAAQLQLLHGRKSFDYLAKAHPSVIRKAYEVQLPQLPEQKAIAAILSDMDAEIDALEAKLAKARQIKTGMMQELLTGRIRLV